jgi:hypothetical protein
VAAGQHTQTGFKDLFSSGRAPNPTGVQGRKKGFHAGSTTEETSNIVKCEEEARGKPME